MYLQNNNLYQEDIEYVAGLALDWSKLKDKSLLITGATGMIGSFLVDVIMHKNAKDNLGCSLILLGRDERKAKERFAEYFNESSFSFFVRDVNKDMDIPLESIDYLIHAASNTHPMLYSTDPIGTMMTNIIGTRNLLELSKKMRAQRILFLSSVEIYGENRGDCEKYTEDYCGYIDCNTVRAGYTEGKRAGEALCQAYIKQEGLDIVIPRLARIYGPTMLKSDTKALSQFINKGVAKEDIVLKSAGTQLFSYCYVADAVAGLLFCLFEGSCGEAYNIADRKSDVTLKELSEMIAHQANRRVVYEIPDAVEQTGYSKATKALLDSTKLQKLGWLAKYSIEDGIIRTMNMLETLK